MKHKKWIPILAFALLLGAAAVLYALRPDVRQEETAPCI